MQPVNNLAKTKCVIVLNIYIHDIIGGGTGGAGGAKAPPTL